MQYKLMVFILAICLLLAMSGCSHRQPRLVQVQLNWLHDPTFAGEYLAAAENRKEIELREGGPGVFPVAEVTSGRAQYAVVGADVFLEALDKDIRSGKDGKLVCVFVDLQRNPVGWVLHPKTASRAGLTPEVARNPRALNAWLFRKLADGSLNIGDKRGTETTSIWVQWSRVHHSPERVKVVPVGFDTGVVLTAPNLAYPVYLNEEPYKLSEKIGKQVIVCDPAYDGVELYGNVVVTSKQYADNNVDAVRRFQSQLRKGWLAAKATPDKATREVSAVYKGVSDRVLQQQLGRTTEFVFHGGQLPGAMDVRQDGRWANTLNALQEADLVSRKLSFTKLQKYLLPPQ